MNIQFTLETLENSLVDLEQHLSDIKLFIKPPYPERVEKDISEIESKIKEVKEVKKFLEEKYPS